MIARHCLGQRRKGAMEELPEGFDLAALLAPIPGDAPAGENLRDDATPESLYYRLRDARAEARAAERLQDAPNPETGAFDASAAPPQQWRIIRELSHEALLTRSKDLEIAAWLTEALLRSDGLVGLDAGCRLMTGLVETYWDGLFPQPDEDGIATRVAPIAGLNGEGRDGTLTQPIRKLPLFERPSGEAFRYWQYEQSFEVAGIADAARRQQRIDAGVLPIETVDAEAAAAEKLARETGKDGFAALRRRAADAAAAWQALGQALDSRAGADAPATSQVRELLEKLRAVTERFAPGEEEAVSVAEPTAAPGAPAAATAAAAAGVSSREDALRTLAQLADYFRRTEPHSPLAYTLQEAVRRARMTWPELLEEIVPDAAARSAILSSLGIRPPPAG
jgi:type VI secretion system protein ImpA